MTGADKSVFMLVHQFSGSGKMLNELIIRNPNESYQYTLVHLSNNQTWLSMYYNQGERGDSETHLSKTDAIDWCVQHWVDNR